MGWITNVYFPEGVELNGTKICPGMNTQVRWALEIDESLVGGIEVDCAYSQMP